jgi:hypothetical protein
MGNVIIAAETFHFQSPPLLSLYFVHFNLSHPPLEKSGPFVSHFVLTGAIIAPKNGSIKSLSHTSSDSEHDCRPLQSHISSVLISTGAYKTLSPRKRVDDLSSYLMC